MDFINTIDNIFLQRVCDYFQLGRLKNATLVSKSLHWVWRMQTQTNTYALKILNNKILAITNASLLSIAQTQVIASYMQAQGVSTIIAQSINQDYTTNINNIECMIFPWLAGQPFILTTEKAQQIGMLLANIHSAKLHLSNLPCPNWQGFSSSHWQYLLTDINNANTINIQLLDLVKWSALAAAANNELHDNLVISHRDLDPKNIIWQTSPVLIDWDYAGLINPLLELFIVALNWSNVTALGFDEKMFSAVYAGYRKILPKTPAFSSIIIAGYAGYVLDWIEWNLRRASIPEERSLAHAAIKYSIMVLHVIMEKYSTAG